MYELTVENMTCGHCVSAVTEAVHTIDRPPWLKST